MHHSRDNPYVGPRTFTEEEGDLFFGREREARDLLSLLLSERLVLFYAQSGAGKSSLINTRLRPGLRTQGFEILPVGRVRGDLPEGIPDVENIFVFNLILSLDQNRHEAASFAHTPLGGYLQGYQAEIRDGKQKSETPWVLIIDQFEEIFTTNLEHWEKREDFFGQLRQAMSADPLLWVVLSLREDFVAPLEPYARLLPGRLRTRFYMRRLGYRAALEAVERPAEQAGRSFAPGVAQILVDNLRQVPMQDRAGEPLLGEFVEPVQLQVVCYQLWDNLKGRPPGEITEHDVRELGDVDTALAQFYEQAIAEAVRQTNVSEIDLRDWFESRLITEAGTRGMVFRGNEQSGGLANQTVDLLADRFLVRAEARTGGTWYELIHDRFVEPILGANQAWRLKQPLIQMAQAWRDSGKSGSKLLEGGQLEEYLSTNWQSLGPLVHEFLEASQEAQQSREEALEAEREAQRQRELEQAQALAEEQQKRAEEQTKATKRLLRLAIALAVVFLLAVGAAIIAFRQQQAAEARRAEAEAAQQEAIAAEATAEARRVEAEAAQQEALAAEATAEARRVEAEAAQQEALVQAAIATSRRLASSAITSLESNPQRGLLLAVEALNVTNTVEADNALRQALQASQVRAILRNHLGRVNALAFSPNGDLLATASADSTARLWDVETGTELANLSLHEDSVVAVAFSPDGEVLATASADSTVILWDVFAALRESDSRSAVRQALRGHQDSIIAVAFSPDGQRLATASADGTARVWDVSRGETLAVLVGHEESVNAVALSPDGTRVGTASLDGTARLWDVETGDQLTVLEGHTSGVNSVVFSPDGLLLATAGADGTARLWDVASGAPLTVLTGHTDSVTTIRFSPDGSLLATGSSDDTARLWDVENREEKHVLRGHEDRVTSVTFDNAGHALATASADGSARIWDVDSGDLQATLQGHTSSVNVVLFSPDGELLASASSDNTARLWTVDAAGSAAQIVLPSEGFFFNAVAFNPDGKLLAASDEGGVRIWDVSTALDTHGGDGELAVLGMPEGMVPVKVKFSPNGRLLAATSLDYYDEGSGGAVHLWDVEKAIDTKGSDAEVAVLTGLGEFAFGLAFSPDGGLLAASSWDESGGPFDSTVHIWDVARAVAEGGGQPRAILRVPGEILVDVAFSPDGSLLAASDVTVGREGEIGSEAGARLWNVAHALQDSAEAEVAVLRGHEGVVAGVAFSPDGSLLATSNIIGDSAASESTVRLWDVAQALTTSGSDAEVAVLQVPGEGSFSVTLSPDGRTLAASSQDGTAHLWDVSAALDRERDEAEVAVLRGHAAAIKGIAFSPDGSLLATSGEDNTVRLWTVRATDLLEMACNRATRNLSQDEWETAFGRNTPYRQTCSNLPYHPSAIEALTAQGRAYARQGDIDAALDILRQVEQLDPSIDPQEVVVEALVQRAGEYSRAGESENVLNTLEKALELDPSIESDSEVAMLKAEAYARQGRVDEALDAIRQAVELDPSLELAPEEEVARILVEQTQEFIFSGQYDEALDAYGKAAELDPSLEAEPEAGVARMLVDMAQEMVYSGRYDQALDAYREAAGLDPSLGPEVARLLVDAADELVSVGQYDQALEAYRQASELDPSLELVPEAQVALGKARALVRQGQVDDALVAFSEAAALDPSLESDPEAVVAQMLVEVAQQNVFDGQYDEALEAYREAVELDPSIRQEVARLLVELAQEMVFREQYDQALETYRKAVELDPTLELVPEAEVALAQGRALVRQGQVDDALVAFGQAAELDPSLGAEVARMMLDVAREMVYSIRYDQALEVYREAAELDPPLGTEVARLLVDMAHEMVFDGQYDEALEAYRKALELDPSLGLVPEAEVALAKVRALARDGLVEEALEALEDAIEFAPQLEISRKSDLAFVYYEVCSQSLYEDVAEIASPACERAGELAVQISFGETVTGVVDSGGGDLWAFEGSAGQTVTIRMDEDNSGLDTFLTLLGTDWGVLAEDDDSGDRANSLIERFVLPETGSYTIAAHGIGDSSGAYRLTLIEEGAGSE